MASVNKLLALGGHPLKVTKDCNGLICVEYASCEIKDGAFLVGDPGRGASFESACDNYLNKISGKTLVFHAGYDNEERIRVL